MDGIDPRLRGPEQPAPSQTQSYSDLSPSQYPSNPIRLPPPSPQQSHHQVQAPQGRQHEHNTPSLPFWQQDVGNVYHQQSPNLPTASPFPQGNNATIIQGQSHRHGPGESKRPRACEACRGLKVRCEFDEGANDCKRCVKAGRQCQVTQPSRKRQKKTDTKVAELEKKIEALNAAIQGRGDLPLSGNSEGETYDEGDTSRITTRESNGTPARVSTIVPAGPEDGSRTLPHESYGRFTEQKSPYASISASPNHKRRSLNYMDERSKHNNQSQSGPPISVRQQPDFGDYTAQATTGASDSANIHPLLVAEAAFSKATGHALPDQQDAQIECERILNRYLSDLTAASKNFLHFVRNMSTQTPIVAFCPDVDPGFVRESKPFLFLTVVTIASNTNIQPELMLELTKVLADQIMVKANKSLELVQVLQLLALYYWPSKGRDPIYNTYIELARTMAFDLGISKPSPHSAYFSLWAFQNLQLSDTELVEGARACLGNFLTVKNVKYGSRHRFVTLECLNDDASLQLLESSPGMLASDQDLCQWTRSERVAYRYALHSGKGGIKGTLQDFTKDMIEGKTGIAAMNGSNALKMIYHAINLDLYDHTKSIQLPSSESHGKNLCLSSVHGILESFLKLPPNEVVTLPVFQVIRVVNVMFTMVQMLHDKTFQNEELNIQLYLDGIITKLRASARQRNGQYVYWLLVVLTALSLWLEKKRATASGLQLLSDVAVETGVAHPPNEALIAFKLAVADSEIGFLDTDAFAKLLEEATNQVSASNL